MALVHKQTYRREIPHEPGQWFEFRPLTGGERDAASESRLRQLLPLVKELEALTNRPAAEDAADDPAVAYDKEMLIRFGVVNWSYDEPCDDENKAQLDARTREWAAGVIAGDNSRSEDEKKGSAVSSSTGQSQESPPN